MSGFVESLMTHLEQFSGRCWRVSAPGWAHDPISGFGAAQDGRRWNRRGQPAIYASTDLDTAMDEYWQDLRDRPGTFFAVDVEEARILDFRKPEVSAAVGLKADDIFCHWEKILFVDGLVPPTWLATDRALTAGANGLLVPSARRPHHTNLVLWPSDVGGARVKVYDPRNEMPKPPANQP